MNIPAIVRKPSAFLPMAMSVGALAVVLGHVVLYGAAREADESAAAHMFQILMAAQVPIVGFFAVRWLPREPRPALAVLTLQVGAALLALAPVYLLNL